MGVPWQHLELNCLDRPAQDCIGRNRREFQKENFDWHQRMISRKGGKSWSPRYRFERRRRRRKKWRRRTVAAVDQGYNFAKEENRDSALSMDKQMFFEVWSLRRAWKKTAMEGKGHKNMGPDKIYKEVEEGSQALSTLKVSRPS